LLSIGQRCDAHVLDACVDSHARAVMLVVSSNHNNVVLRKMLPRMRHGLTGMVAIAREEDEINIILRLKARRKDGDAGGLNERSRSV